MSDSNSTIKITMLSIIALVIIAVATIFYIEPAFIKKELPKPVVINTENQPTLGNPTAKVHFVAFEDLKCSNCARFNKQLMPYIEKEFINTGIAKYTMMNVAFIQGSMPAANAARCIYTQNNALFFDYVKIIFTHQPPENEDWATIPALLNFANDVKGINTDQLAQCIVKSPYDSVIQANLAQAVKIMDKGIVSTPTLYINGILVKPLTKSRINAIVKAIS